MTQRTAQNDTPLAPTEQGGEAPQVDPLIALVIVAGLMPTVQHLAGALLIRACGAWPRP